MVSLPTLRSSHPCLRPGCGHADGEHLATPELAGPNETVVWCVTCRRHEVRRPHAFWGFFTGERTAKKVVRISRPN